jgi:hypothetical protein
MSGLGRFLNLAVADAGSARAKPFTCTVYQGMNRLQIYVPAAVRYVMGVTDFVPELRTFAANVTDSGHLKENSSRRMRRSAQTLIITHGSQRTNGT